MFELLGDLVCVIFDFVEDKVDDAKVIYNFNKKGN